MGERLGQNFLKDENVVKKIIKAADLKSDDVVLEVGPGKGVLTEELAKHAGKVLAVEIDSNLADLLCNKLSNNKNIEIINEDVLEIFNTQYPISNQYPIFNDLISNKKPYKVIANIPYYITSKIIRLFLESENPPSEMILMVQKEVAERIVANPGQMSILAVSVQYYAKAEYLFTVGRESFDPAPEVDSAVIKISGIRNQEAGSRNNEEVKKFFRIVKAGFCARRKILVNNLSNSFHLNKKEVEEKLEAIGIASAARAQELSVEDWKKLLEIF